MHNTTLLCRKNHNSTYVYICLNMFVINGEKCGRNYAIMPNCYQLPPKNGITKNLGKMNILK